MNAAQRKVVEELRRLAQWPQFFRAEIEGNRRGVVVNGERCSYKDMVALEDDGIIHRLSDEIIEELPGGYRCNEDLLVRPKRRREIVWALTEEWT